MSAYPLYNMMFSYRAPIAPIEEYLRDKERPRGHVESRRKQELQQVLTAFGDGQHPVTATMMALDTVLSATRQPLYHWVKLAKDQTSFNGFFGKNISPEEVQAKRMAHINQLVHEIFNYPYNNPSYALSNQDREWIKELMASLDQPETKAIDIVERLATKIIVAKGEIGGLKQVLEQLKKHRHDDERDNLEHPNDQYNQQDLLTVMKDYRLLDWTESDVRYQYLTDKAIEQKRTASIIDILTAWREGRHPLLVLADLTSIHLENLNQPYYSMITKAHDTLRSEKSARREAPHKSFNEYYLVSVLLEQDDVRRQARDIMRQMREPVAAYRGPASNPDLATQIDNYIDHVVHEPQSSFNVIQNIATAILIDGAPELDRIFLPLKEQEKKEAKAREKRRPMGTLITQTDSDMRGRLKDIFTSRSTPTEPSYKLTQEILIEPVGSGMIKPYPDGEDDGGWEEDLYGTITARITTYAVSLIPISPDLTEKLKVRVEQALEEIAEVEPAFAIPFDHDSEPYERPINSEKNSSPKYSAFESLHVEIKGGAVKIFTRLDLDDLWNLYYLLEDVIEPSEQIAASMNSARYAEARGVLLSKDGLDTSYSNTPFEPQNRLGSLDQENPEKYLISALRDTFVLYTIDEIDEEQFIHRMIMLADHALMGNLTDPTDTFLPLSRLIAQSEESGTEIVTYDSALKDTVKKMLMLVSGIRNADTPLDRALLNRIHAVGDTIRENLQSQARAQVEQRWQEARRALNVSGTRSSDIFEDIKKDLEERLGKEGAANLLGDGEAQDNQTQEVTDEEKIRDYALARKANLAFRKGDIGTTTDRTWRGTDYVSRSPGSIWVRKELPSSLASFVPNNAGRDMKSMMRAIGF